MGVITQVEAHWMACDNDAFEIVLNLLAHKANLDLLIEYREAEPIRHDVLSKWVWSSRALRQKTTNSPE